MKRPKPGLLVALALAGGVAIGAAGSAIAANPTSSPAPSTDLWSRMTQMMGGAGVMGRFAPGASFGPGMMNGPNGAGMMGRAGMMGGLDPAQRDALLRQCDELHDAMRAAAGSPRALSLHDLDHAGR